MHLNNSDEFHKQIKNVCQISVSVKAVPRSLQNRRHGSMCVVSVKREGEQIKR